MISAIILAGAFVALLLVAKIHVMYPPLSVVTKYHRDRTICIVFVIWGIAALGWLCFALAAI